MEMRAKAVSRFERTVSAIALTLGMAAAAPASAQEVYGVPGSPSSSMSIEGSHLPPNNPPYPMQWGGVISPELSQSKPWWSPRVVPPKGAPNILLIMTDDAGYGVASTFGGGDPDAGARSDRRQRPALHQHEFHGLVLADPGRPHHRPQPP
jgi:arylsulfatase